MTTTLRIQLLDEVHQRLARYARARGITPEEAAAGAVESYLREAGDIAARIAEARAVASAEARTAFDNYVREHHG